MKQTLPRGLGLVLATSLWIAATIGVVLLAPGVDRGAGASDLASSSFAASIRGEGWPQEPPEEKTLWDHFGAGAAALFHFKEADVARAGVNRAIEKLGVSAWRLAGHRGKGLKIAVLDSGFKGYPAALGKALPARIKAKSFRKDGKLEAKESQHGILCAEVIHHLAPDAEILFANWEPEEAGSFLDAVRWARGEGARIISCSIIMPAWSDGEGGGSIHKALREALGEGARPEDGLFFASAGNTAQRHWSGHVAASKDGWHQWIAGKTDNALRPLGMERVSVELCSRFAAFDLLVRDTTLKEDVRVVRSQGPNACHCAAVRFMPQARHHYTVRVRPVLVDPAKGPKGKPEDWFHLTVLGGKLQYALAAGSIPFPGDGPEVVAVGAVNEQGRLFTYSSCGPKVLSLKPDLVATVPFPSVWRPYQSFGGTSAAAPQAAGLAALLWSRSPSWSADRVRKVLCQAALHGPALHSAEFGFGLVRMPPLGR